MISILRSALLPALLLATFPSLSQALVQVQVADGTYGTSCNSSQISVDENGTVTLADAACFANINTAGSGNLAFQSGASTRYCTLGKLSEDAAGSVQITAASGCLVPVAGSPLYRAVLDASVTNGVLSVEPASDQTYTVTVTNAGPGAVTESAGGSAWVTVTAESGLSYLNLVGATLSGGAERLGGGRAAVPVDEAINLPVGSSIVYTFTGRVVGGEGDAVKVGVVLTHRNGDATNLIADNVKGDSATDSDAITFPLAMVITDGQSSMGCGATRLSVDANGELTVHNAGCFDSIEGSGGLAQFTQEGRNARRCAMTHLVAAADGSLQLTTNSACFTGTAVADSDGDGVPDIYDAEWGRGVGDCTEVNGMVAISNKTYQSTASCSAQISVATGSNVNLAGTAANVTYQAGESIHLFPGFYAAAGSHFHASISTTAAKAARAASDTGTASADAAESAVQIAPPVRLFQEALPAALRELLTQTGAVATEGYADAAGERIVFATEGALTVQDTNGVSDVYLYDLRSSQLRLVSVGLSGQAADGASGQPRIDGNGSYVVFSSAADDLVSGDANGVADIFLLDLASGHIERISADIAGQAMGNAANPVIATSQPEVLFDRVVLPAGVRHVYRGNYLWPSEGVEPISYDLDEQDRLLDNHHPAVSADSRFVVYREDNAVSCGIRLNDYQQGTTILLACPDALLDATKAFEAEISADGSTILWRQQDAESSEAGQSVTIANPLLR